LAEMYAGVELDAADKAYMIWMEEKLFKYIF
jgi:hypothetical protein